MRFSIAATAALFGAVLAAPAPQANPDPRETITVQKFKAVNKNLSNDGPVTSISFQIISHREAGVAAFVCEASNPEGLGSDIVNCNGGWDNDAYRFQLRSHKDNVFNLTVYHQTAPAFGFWGNFFVPALCLIENGATTCVKDQTKAELHVYE